MLVRQGTVEVHACLLIALAQPRILISVGLISTRNSTPAFTRPTL